MRVEAFVNPNVLLWARQMAGLEAEEVARKVGTPSHRLESWERGELRPSITQLRKLADIYKRPLAIFFLQKPPPDDPAPRDFRRFDPQAAEPLSPRLRLAIRDARARRESAIELFSELDEEPPQFKLGANLGQDPDRVGERLHRALTAGAPWPGGHPRTVFNMWCAAVESAGVLVFQARNVDVEEMRGFSITERPLPVVVLNIKDAYAARSFSLLHEVTHVMLNRGGLCILEESGPRSYAQRLEVFCNHVAGAVLMPAVSLLRQPETPAQRVEQIPDETLSTLAGRYGASEEAVLRRLVILGRVPLKFYQRRRHVYQQRYERRRQTTQRGFAPPHRLAVARAGRMFTRLVLEAYDEERITTSDVSAYLGVQLKHLDRIRAEAEREAGNPGAVR